MKLTKKISPKLVFNSEFHLSFFSLIAASFLFCETAFCQTKIENSITSPEMVIAESLAEKKLKNFRNVEGKEVTRFEEKTPKAFYPNQPTPSRFFKADLSMPETFGTTNNLVKKVGSFYRAFGEIIFLQGTIVDSFGVPISGAVVEIWQTNAAGKYHSLLEPNSEYVDKYFNMSGRAITDNLGNYHFITILPGSSIGRAPHINFNIYHQNFGKLETEMYFEKHPFNDSDYQYLAYDDEDKKMITAKVAHSDIYDTKSIKICTFNVVLKGIHQFKKI